MIAPDADSSMTEAKKLNFRNSKILNYRKICAIQALRLKEIERRLMEDTRRKKHDWERDVEKMREEFLTLHPCDELRYIASSSSTADSDEQNKRRGSADVLDSKQMKTMFLEYPDAGNVTFTYRRNVSFMCKLKDYLIRE